MSWKKIINELVEDSLEERENKIRNYLIEVREFLMTNGHFYSFSEYTMKTTAMGIVRGFYKSFGGYITIQTSSNARPKNLNRLRITKEILRNILKYVGNQKYAIILKIEAILGLRFSDIINGLEYYKLQKYKDHNYIKDFKTRKDGIIINFLFFPREIEEDICIYLHREDLRDVSLYKIFMRKGRTMIRNSDFNGAIKKICRDSLKLDGIFSSHQLRKDLRRRLGKSGISHELKEHLIGHSLKNDVYIGELTDIDEFYSQILIKNRS